eukprot:CAMPEP_0116891394 /NCGR_PEP_ID=MMETSP0467-20121206/1818_1 /TAXON_ID=283647 /ORGANISM="Mesodinium pulex, Strain SPMC105" /LENGTH=82 /DNA_ID=CAMNT_0004559881 /DNA_START=852 /DNA_END=1100 /DNA_ORIENTATION=-
MSVFSNIFNGDFYSKSYDPTPINIKKSEDELFLIELKELNLQNMSMNFKQLKKLQNRIKINDNFCSAEVQELLLQFQAHKVS